MAAVQYSKTSPYFGTDITGNYLDVASFPVMPKFPDDVSFVINKTYQYRPDLLASDLYGDANLWWVFAVRNPDVLMDPVFNFVAPTVIYVPNKQIVLQALGI